MNISRLSSSGGFFSDDFIAWVGRMLLMFFFAAALLVGGYSASVAGLLVWSENAGSSFSFDALASAFSGAAIAHFNSGFSAYFANLPYPDGMFVGRAHALLSTTNPLFFHLTVNAIVFAIAGSFAAGMSLGVSILLVPLVLGALTRGLLLNNMFVTLPDPSQALIAVIFVQCIAIYGIGLLGRFIFVNSLPRI